MKYEKKYAVKSAQFGTDDKYSNEKGFGLWEPVVSGGEYRTDSEVALFNGGWNKRRIHEGFSYDSKRRVTIFKADVPEFGTYEVEVSVKAVKSDIENLTLFAGRRNMLDRGICIKEGETYAKVFYQAVFPYIPALTSKRQNDKEIYLSWTGIKSDDEIDVEISIKRKEVPVIWVAGDSTLTDQNAGIPYYPFGSCAGWAQVLGMHVEAAAVCNLAHSGMTSNCFRDDGHYDIAREYMKSGDLFIMQFGHNDQKRRNLSAFGGYEDNLRRFVKEVREKGVVPVIVSPISRIPIRLSQDEMKELDMPEYYSLLAEHARACKKVAEEEKVAFVDLHKETFDKWISLGEAARDYFMSGDITHTNEYGAVLIEDMFVKNLRNISEVCEKDGISEVIRNMFTPENMNLQEEKCPFTPESDSKELPKENPGPGLFEIDPPYVDIQGIPEYDDIRKAFKYGLLDPCVMYLHPYDDMPRGQVLMVMFNAFRMPGVRPYKNKFADIKVDEWISGYVQALIEKDMIDPQTIMQHDGKLFFRPDDALTYGELAGYLIRKLYNKDISLEEACDKAISLGIYKSKDIKPVGKINRAEVYTALALYMDISGGTQDKLPEDAEVHPVH